MTMTSKTYTVRFNTPAFLGDADQKGAWRTPPFKALLREWWRIVAARDFGYDHTALREAEGRLFGHAWLKRKMGGKEKTWAMQGLVRIKLDHWRHGSLTKWTKDPKINHPEVNRKVGSHLYLGYGPLTASRGTDLRNQNPAIDVTDEVKLRIACPEEKVDNLHQTLRFIHWFGAIGGRCRNGWGSLCIITDRNDKSHPVEDLLDGKEISYLLQYSRSFQECMELDWPHAFGKSSDHQPLLWKTNKPTQTWSDLMKYLAEIKIAFRMATNIPANGRFGDRHILAYPVTHHSVREWGNQSRLANQIRFKVVRLRNGMYVGLAYHLPHGLPEELKQKLNQVDRKYAENQQLGVWRKIHEILDQKMTRIREARP